LATCVLTDHPLKRADVKEQINQRVRDNPTITTDRVASEMSIPHGMKLCSNGLTPKQKHFILTESRNSDECC